MPHRHAVLEGRRLFVAGIPRMEDEHDAIVQICRVFLREGFDLKHVSAMNLRSDEYMLTGWSR